VERGNRMMAAYHDNEFDTPDFDAKTREHYRKTTRVRETQKRKELRRRPFRGPSVRSAH